MPGHAMRLRQSAKNGDWTVFAEQALAKVNSACYSSPPRKTAHVNAACSEKKREKVELDEIFETLHNLASSLMNKTLLQLQHRMIFKNLQSINVGV